MGAYSGFPRGGTNSKGGGGHRPIIRPNFSENCMKKKKIGSGERLVQKYIVQIRHFLEKFRHRIWKITCLILIPANSLGPKTIITSEGILVPNDSSKLYPNVFFLLFITYFSLSRDGNQIKNCCVNKKQFISSESIKTNVLSVPFNRSPTLFHPRFRFAKVCDKSFQSKPTVIPSNWESKSSIFQASLTQ